MEAMVKHGWEPNFALWEDGTLLTNFAPVALDGAPGRQLLTYSCAGRTVEAIADEFRRLGHKVMEVCMPRSSNLRALMRIGYMLHASGCDLGHHTSHPRVAQARYASGFKRMQATCAVEAFLRKFNMACAHQN